MLLTSMVRSRMPGRVSDRDVHGAVVEDVLVDLVGDGERIELLAELGDERRAPRA